jgi:hypothetical protein
MFENGMKKDRRAEIKNYELRKSLIMKKNNLFGEIMKKKNSINNIERNVILCFHSNTSLVLEQIGKKGKNLRYQNA